ncbi:MAG TPA: CHASE2 domain-containing protein, partial [Candidatus Nitrosotenuis sp.]|nr:CHASE2 domain-containing protein [Candidatus Nitrosotenuis sp.]
MKGPAPGLRLPVQPVLLLTVLLCALAAWGLDALVSDMRTVELSLYNLRLGLLTSGRMDPSIVVAGVDRESLDRLGDWPFSRGLHARALRNLARDGARVVFFDFQFYDRGSKDPEGDERLVEAVRQTGLAILASRVSQSGGGYVLDRLFEPLNRVAEVAHINTRPDRDRAIRWAILALPLFHGGSIADARAYARAPKVPSAALALFARVQGVPASEIGFGQGAIRVGSKTVPTTWEGPDYHGFNYELPILFRGGLQTVSYWRLVDPGDPVHSSLKGKVVLVGQMLEGNEDDVFLTPAGKMKGVAVHAHVLDTLLSGWYLHPAPTWLDFVALLIVCLDTGVTVERARSAVSSLLSLGLILVAYAGLNFLLFANRLWLDLAT